MRRLRSVGLSTAEGVRVVVFPLVVELAFVALVGVELRAVDRLDVLPQRGGVSVALCAARGFAYVRFLKEGVSSIDARLSWHHANIEKEKSLQ